MSIASGVSTGRTASRKNAREPRLLRRGHVGPRQQPDARGRERRAQARLHQLAERQHLRPRALADERQLLRGRQARQVRRRVSPSSTSRIRPATRTMKNSSRFEATMAANLTRSSSGTPASAASSSTRSLNASHDSSRLMNSDGSSTAARAHSVAPAWRIRIWRPYVSANMSARADGHHPLHRDVAGALELEDPGLAVRDQPDVRDFLQVLGIERIRRRAGSPPAC